jgi:hypothetical protein
VLGSGTTVPVIFTYVEKFGGNGGPGEVRRTNLPDEIDSYMRCVNSHPAHLPTANLPQLRRTGGRCKTAQIQSRLRNLDARSFSSNALSSSGATSAEYEGKISKRSRSSGVGSAGRA